MSLDTWVSIGVLFGFAIALFGYLSSTTHTLRHEFAGLRSELKTDIGGLDTKITDLRTEVRTDSAALGARITDLRTEVRTDIAALDTKITDLRTEVKTDIAGLDTKITDLRAELKIDIGAVGAGVQKLDERVYDLATGRRTHPLIVPPSR